MSLNLKLLGGKWAELWFLKIKDYLFSYLIVQVQVVELSVGSEALSVVIQCKIYIPT